MSRRFAAKAILFDLDGTLLDTIADLTEAANLMLDELGRPTLSQACVLGFVGRGINDLVRRCLAESRDPTTAEVSAAHEIFRRHYTHVNGQTTRPYPGVPELLAALAARRLKMAVVTNKSAIFALPLLQQFDLARHFGAFVCGDTLPVKKPDPAMIHHACNLLGAKPEESLMIGDSINDSLAARAAGVPVLLVKYGYSEGMPVDAIDCDGLLDNARQITDHLVDQSDFGSSEYNLDYRFRENI
ncbi:MAG: phosphoglycolate phosphatase [Azoarcus sp.]|jgi:phosphoglycolate phosphatase|nr:phosphoglycolate phosphatase [Azoarcus sp.]